MRILLTGANGQVGWELARALAPLGEVIELDRSRLDLAQPDALRETVRAIAPDAIVNAAAYTAVDRAESEPELARAINTIAPGILAEEAQHLDAILVHYSTDYVFDGTKAEPYLETDPTEPARRLRPHQARGRACDRRQRLPAPDAAHELGVRRARPELPAHDAAARP